MTSNISNSGILGFSPRIAQAADLDTLHKIVETTINQIYPLYYPCDVVRFFLDHHAPDKILADITAGCVYVFETDSVAIGTGTIHENEIARVFVLPECQGMGYGSAIMEQIEEIIFRTYPVAKLDSSLPAFGLYLKRGYRSSAWRTLVIPSGQVLCYHEMVKENVR
jgi:GNAT superfamily N-acetyltransferase